MTVGKAQILKGFRDFLPESMVVRNEVISRLISVFKKYGYDELQTPALEYKKVLLGKYGEEAEHLMYLFKDKGDREVGLRYDLTVPLARAMASNRNLPIPFKRYQIQPLWRAEKPQKGRYREFYQCDVDIVGSSSPMADAEILAIINDSLKILGFSDFNIQVNSRQVLYEILKISKIETGKWTKVLTVMDKLEKKEKSEVEKELIDNGLEKSQIERLFSEIDKAKPDNFLENVITFAGKLGVSKNITFVPSLARGLSYYTGPIYESVVKNPKIGSITGGGRYDKLLSDLGGPDLPATGTSFGLDRLVDVINELSLWKNIKKTKTSVLVTVFSEKLLESSFEVVNLLRKSGIPAELYPDAHTKLDKQLKYADNKDINWVVIIGPDEVLKKSAVLKNLKTKTQEVILTSGLLTKIQ
jgi:histidyl-tRNA synthetase